jgi:hemerythrin-like domain-containing protein
VPIKRDASLIPLSHDHHHALVRVFEIRQALTANTGLEAQVTRTREFFECNLKPHFRAEEEALLPALARFVGENDPMIARLTTDHRRLEAAIDQLETKAGTLAAFADSLESHIRFEERELFQRYQEDVPEQARRAVEGGIRRILGREED